MIFRIKVTLLDIEPPIWRRIEVRDDTTFAELHDVLQVVMGWENDHLHEFEVRGKRYGVDMDADGDFGPPPGSSVKLSEVVRRVKGKLLYTYDFGDCWRHELIVEKIEEEEPGKQYPVCLEGERACPLEDCGGVWAYQNLLQALEHPDDPENEELLEWAGDLDPEKFDLEQVNHYLS